MQNMQAWEYKVIHRQREVRGGNVASWDVGVIAQLPELGNEGWELIAVVPRSSEGGAANSGVTTDELWIFKRPKAVMSAEALVVVAENTDVPATEDVFTDAVATPESAEAGTIPMVPVAPTSPVSN